MDKTLTLGLEALAAGDAAVGDLLRGRWSEITGLLNKYIEEIELFNPAYGLVGAGNRRDLVVKHILDSLAPLGILLRLLATDSTAGTTAGIAAGTAAPSAETRIADVGSGAGLPGIPLAISLPDRSFTLIERMGRRAGFLRNTLAVLGLSQVEIEEGEMEAAPPGSFDLVCFRAFRPLDPALLRGLFRILKPGGVLGAYKGRAESVKAEMGGIREPPLSWEALPCPVPFLEEERHLVVIRPG